jgi:hypothetical protein
MSFWEGQADGEDNKFRYPAVNRSAFNKLGMICDSRIDNIED